VTVQGFPLFFVATSVAIVLGASSAGATMTKQACAKANADGQASRLDGKLLDARRALQMCVDPSCPAIVRADCAQRLSEVDRAQPTILFDVKDVSGNDVGAVGVTVDGLPVAENVGGTALPIDPGDHAFTFAAAGSPTLTRHFVLKEHEKDRRERIVLGAPPAVADAKPADAPSGLGTQKLLGLSAAGVGAIGLVVGSIFGVLTFSAVSQENTACGGGARCANPVQGQSAYSTSVTDSTVSTAAFIAGGVLLAGGGLLYFTSPRGGSTPARGLLVLPSVGPGGGTLSVRAEF
jgi:hypothetical protein